MRVILTIHLQVSSGHPYFISVEGNSIPCVETLPHRIPASSLMSLGLVNGHDSNIDSSEKFVPYCPLIDSQQRRCR